jgi:hypothetical protein
MTTSFIGLKELRQTLAAVADAAHKRKHRYIVMRKNKPVFELRPLSAKEATFEALAKDLEEAEDDVRAGRVHTPEEVERMLGL